MRVRLIQELPQLPCATAIPTGTTVAATSAAATTAFAATATSTVAVASAARAAVAHPAARALHSSGDGPCPAHG